MPPTGFDHPLLVRLFDYWNEKRGSRRLPARVDIDPLEMGPKLLPHLLLCDLLDRGARSRFRLVGTSMVKRLGFDPTGQPLAAQPAGGYFALMATLHRLCFTSGAPIFSESAFRWGSDRRLDLRQLLLPLGNGGGEPAIVLMGVVFASDEVFPPQIRALNDIAHYSERRRELLPLPSPDWHKVAPLNVA